MGDFDWDALTGRGRTASEDRRRGDTCSRCGHLGRHVEPGRLPPMIREMLADPARPRVADGEVTVQALTAGIVGAWERSEGVDRSREKFASLTALAADLGYEAGVDYFPGLATPDWQVRGPWEVVHAGVHCAISAEKRQDEAAYARERDEGAWDAVPADGDGLTLAEVAAAISMSPRRARDRVTEALEAGELRVGERRTRAGGTPAKVYWRADDEGGDGGDNSGT